MSRHGAACGAVRRTRVVQIPNRRSGRPWIAAAQARYSRRMGDFDLSGHVAVVTGANSGIGRGIAHGLADAGADVAIWGRTAERNAEAREELSRHGTRIVDVVCDVSDPSAVSEAFARTLEELGRIDSCFANAGGGDLHASFVDMTLDDFRRVVAVNLDGAFLTLQGAARHMIDRGGGGSLVG